MKKDLRNGAQTAISNHLSVINLQLGQFLVLFFR